MHTTQNLDVLQKRFQSGLLMKMSWKMWMKHILLSIWSQWLHIRGSKKYHCSNFAKVFFGGDSMTHGCKNPQGFQSMIEAPMLIFQYKYQLSY